MESLVETVAERIGDHRVQIVRLEIGALAGVACEALHFCFETCVAGTALAGARLEILPIAGRALCRACGTETDLPWFGAPCACGSFDREVVAGTELRLKEVEVD
jgi:hydrogenase nickel incorporation protein HypA/HybF